ncbi:4-hydroxy-3-methylbut-2-enyl diphosphate reductase [Candidatus Erwinia haradaeae]|uniref:4-hydroxy-3-methylbut-2-enyl diphosphate reductase n=1 Tax=Candidatus Erwinia haradaeae TaxID=1922217 RepID=A0A451DI72_9GAMM|nr:4-hydroxy-3-methylbut-2-enyl diphosphate reductase [Candidatus Erwinia haradaeae]VFP86357.1 4-hydroxy-3-methylbut-2-enyl diphosphate reductase [Candidatus Erwinia haradaeae]
MKILLANPRGFCAGVDRAISIVERVLDIYGAPIYVRHEIVHNRYVVNNLKNRGVIFIEDIGQIPDRSIVIFSAHGVSKLVYDKTIERDFLIVYDATCPLVKKVHLEVLRASQQGIEAIFIGHKGHPEVEGTMGQYTNPHGGMYLVSTLSDVFKLQIKDKENLRFMMQTTLSIDDSQQIINALYSRFPKIIGSRKNDICYATANRQQAVKNLAHCSELILVVGSKNSSNSNRLVELSRQLGCQTYLIDSEEDIQEEWLQNINCIGITAGASAPDILVRRVIRKLMELGATHSVEFLGHAENIIFQIPKELRIKTKNSY